MTDASNRSAACVLVIDDDDGVRATLEILLDDAGLEVLVAGDGQRGMQLFSDHRVDLVITDVQMPLKTGTQAISEIRSRNRCVPIIAMSGSGKAGADGLLAAAARSGADRVIEKPFDCDELTELVRELLAGGDVGSKGAEQVGDGDAGDGRRTQA